jgi:hypothetical protein
MAPRIQILVSFLYSVGGGVLIGLLALISTVTLRQMPVRAFVHQYAVADSHSSELMDWAGQFAVSISHHPLGKPISRKSVG